MARPVLMDMDPGCDDAVAIVMALGYDDLDIVGVTTGHGNATVEDTTRNARAVLELFGRPDVPVAAGCAEPLVDPLMTAEHIHGPGGIRGPVPDPTAATEPVDTHAAQFIIDKASEYDGSLTLATVGRLTNVAVALALEPDLPDLLDDVVIMGGAAHVSGNVTPMASANFAGDAHAARRTVGDLEPTIVPLDATQTGTLPTEWLESIPQDDDRGEALYEWANYYSEEHLQRYGIETAAMHDGLAITALVDDILETKSCFAEVVADGGIAHGALACDFRGDTDNPPNADVAISSDADRFREVATASLERMLE